MIVERLKNKDNWDEELESFNGGLFMTSTWLEAISENERAPIYLRFFEDNNPAAMLGGIEFNLKNGPAKQLLFYSGIAARFRDPSLVKRCKIALYEYARKNGYQRISLRNYDNHSYLHATVNQFKEISQIEYVFYLDKDTESIINGFSRSVRKRARRAKRLGAVLRKSYSPELTESLFRLINETYNVRQSKGYGTYEYMYLPFLNREKIDRLVMDRQASFFFTEMQGEILSINLLLTCKKKAYGIFMGTSTKGYKIGSPSFHYFELVNMLKEMGYSYYNMGGVHRSIKHRGLKEFKDHLGAKVIESMAEVTNFLSPPLSLLNPILDLKRFSREFKYVPSVLKKPIIYVYNLTLKKIDKY